VIGLDVHRPTPDELRAFSARIAQRLSEHPLDLDPGFHRERVAGLMRQAGEATFYQLLDLPPTAAAQEIHEAYDLISRLVHPANAPRLGLVGREGVLEMLFEQLTQAYLNLSQPERRKAYDRGLSSQTWSAALSPASEQRREEVRDAVERYHKRALELIASDDFYPAIELLKEAVRISPQPELYVLLGKLQAKNPLWLRVAAENLQQAMVLGSKDPELAVALQDVERRIAAGEWRATEGLTTGMASRAARARREMPDIEVLDPEEEIGGRR
jgi:tetratricopeptide (TPR) repeat protein